MVIFTTITMADGVRLTRNFSIRVDEERDILFNWMAGCFVAFIIVATILWIFSLGYLLSKYCKSSISEQAMKQILLRHITNAVAVTMSSVNLFVCSLYILFTEDGVKGIPETLELVLFYIQAFSGAVFVGLRTMELTFFKVIKSEISNSLSGCGCFNDKSGQYVDEQQSDSSQTMN